MPVRSFSPALVAGFCTGLLVAVRCAASGAAPAAADVAPLAYFAGRWTCDVHFADGRPDRRSTRSAAFSGFLSNRFLVQRYESRRPNDGSVFRSLAYDSYSAAQHRFVETDFDSNGGVGTGTSGGWHGGTWYWTYGTAVSVIRRISDHEFLEHDFAPSKSKGRQLFVTLRCRKPAEPNGVGGTRHRRSLVFARR